MYNLMLNLLFFFFLRVYLFLFFEFTWWTRKNVLRYDYTHSFNETQKKTNLLYWCFFFVFAFFSFSVFFCLLFFWRVLFTSVNVKCQYCQNTINSKFLASVSGRKREIKERIYITKKVLNCAPGHCVHTRSHCRRYVPFDN